MKELKCKGCGKEYKVERFYLAHIEKCIIDTEEEEYVKPPVSSVEASFNELTETIEVRHKTDKEIALEEATEFFGIVKNRRIANTPEMEKMFRWYRIIIGKDPGSITCSACVQNVYRVLKLNIK